MSRLDRAVLLTCAAAMAVGLAWDPIVAGLDRVGRTLGGDGSEPAGAVARVASYRDSAEEVPALDPEAADALLDLCLELPEGADPDLHPDGDEIVVLATGRSIGAAMVAWAGPVPAVGDAIGACVGMERADQWHLANRSQRRDPGPGVAHVTWGQYSSRQGAAAGLVGRVPDDVTEVLVVLDDGRVLWQEAAGAVAIVWSPVVRPARLVVIVDGDEIVFEGDVADYG